MTSAEEKLEQLRAEVHKGKPSGALLSRFKQQQKKVASERQAAREAEIKAGTRAAGVGVVATKGSEG